MSILACHILGALLGSGVLADGEDSSRRLGLQDPVHRQMQEAQEIVDGALKFLAENLRRQGDGSFPRTDQGRDPVVAKVALASLAFMAAGHTADEGPYVQEVRSMIRWLLRRATPGECTTCGREDPHSFAYVRETGDNLSRMHGHGYAVWALAMADGMSFGRDNQHDRLELRQRLVASVHCIETAQTENGGWGYESTRGTFHEGSVTVTQLQSLRAAKDAGVPVDRQVIEKALQYLRNSQVKTGPDQGGFRYQLGDLNVSFALTGAALSSLNQTGVYDSDAIDQGLAYMRSNDPFTSFKTEPFPGYSRLYATQAYWQFKDLQPFRKYYPKLVDKLRSERNPLDGSLDSPSEYGAVYDTAMAALALAIPFGYLPSFQR